MASSFPQPSSCSTIPFTILTPKPLNLTSFHTKKLNFSITHCNSSISFLHKDELFLRNEAKKRGVGVVVKYNSGGGGGGGRGDDGATARIVGNIAFAVGLTYLSVTGQLRLLLDAIVSIWLIVVIVPIVGLGVFLWWAGRDIVQGKCPNCGNEFQIFKSTINEEMQPCPFCSEPFSVVDNKFVSDPLKYSNKTTAGQAIEDLPPRSNKENVSSSALVDIEAEVKDAE